MIVGFILAATSVVICATEGMNQREAYIQNEWNQALITYDGFATADDQKAAVDAEIDKRTTQYKKYSKSAYSKFISKSDLQKLDSALNEMKQCSSMMECHFICAKYDFDSIINTAEKKYQAAKKASRASQTRSKARYSGYKGNTTDPKEWIAMRESGGNYNAVSPSGKYIGRYQLSKDKLHGDYSPENQERVADAYVKNRYGSWANAKAHWQKYGWY